MATVIGEFVAKIDADMKGFEKGIKSADTKMGKFATNFAKHSKKIGLGMIAMGAAVAAGMGMAIKSWAAAGDEVQKMALRTGFATEALSELKHAAEISGTSLAGIEKASRTLSGALIDARDGLETYVRAFDELGVSYQEILKLNPEQQFIAVLEALAGVENETIRAARAADLFGSRVGTALLPMLADGVEVFRELRQEAHDLGIVFDQEAADAAASFTDSMDRLNKSLMGVKVSVAEALVPALEPMIQDMTEAGKQAGAFAGENEDLTVGIAKTAVGLIGGGGFVIGMGLLINALKTVLPLIAGVSAALIPLGVGLSLIGFGFTQLAKNAAITAQYNDLVEATNRLSEERVKLLAGETNQYKEALVEYIKVYEAQLLLSDLTEAQSSVYRMAIADLKNYLVELEEYEDAIKDTTEATGAQTDALKEQAEAEKKLAEEKLKPRKQSGEPVPQWLLDKVQGQRAPGPTIVEPEGAPYIGPQSQNPNEPSGGGDGGGAIILLDGEKVGELIMRRAGQSYLAEEHMGV